MSKQTKLDFLFRVEPPCIYLGPGESEREAWIDSYFYSRRDLRVCVRRLRGQKMRKKGALMNEFAAALQFFGGFGENWHALGDCLSCLDDWLPADAYVLVVERAEEVLRKERLRELIFLLRVLHETGEFWATPVAAGGQFDRPAIAFHTLLYLSNTAVAADTDIAKAARDAGVPLRY